MRPVRFPFALLFVAVAVFSIAMLPALAEGQVAAREIVPLSARITKMNAASSGAPTTHTEASLIFDSGDYATLPEAVRPAALQEAGDVVMGIAEGRWTAEHIAAELGEIPIFKSLGLAVEDIFAAHLVLTHAQS
jgi:hypothetical protein